MEIEFDALVQAIQFSKDNTVKLLVIGNPTQLSRFRQSFVRVKLESLQKELEETPAEDPNQSKLPIYGTTVQMRAVDPKTGEVLETPKISLDEFGRIAERAAERAGR